MSNRRPSKAPERSDHHFGERLRRIRQLMGVSQTELADRLRIGQAALSKLESRADILTSTLCQYLEALGAGVHINAILNRSGWRGVADTSRLRAGDLGEQLLLPVLGDLPQPDRRNLVLSIKPEYSTKIVTGKKTVELRRKFPTSVRPGTLMVIYETSPTRAIVGVAQIACVLKGPTKTIWREFSDQACIERGDFDSYFSGIANGFAIKLRGARRLDRALELQELRDRFSFEPPQSFLYAPPGLQEALAHECSKILN